MECFEVHCSCGWRWSDPTVIGAVNAFGKHCATATLSHRFSGKNLPMESHTAGRFVRVCGSPCPCGRLWDAVRVDM